MAWRSRWWPIPGCGIPNEARIRLEVVADGFDAADDWIVTHVQPLDIVVTADVVLASRCVKAGARVLGPGGKLFTEDNVGQAVAMRDLLADLRATGEVTGGPPPLTRRDRSRFLQKLDEVIQAIRRARTPPSRNETPLSWALTAASRVRRPPEYRRALDRPGGMGQACFAVEGKASFPGMLRNIFDKGRLK